MMVFFFFLRVLAFSGVEAGIAAYVGDHYR
jgi:hypothetical protein